jgi:hypothetical protein
MPAGLEADVQATLHFTHFVVANHLVLIEVPPVCTLL